MNFTNNTQSATISWCGTGWNTFHNEYLKFHGWASLLVCIFGSIANSLNIAVLTRREMRSPTNNILTGLAVADLLVMLQYIPFTIHMYLYKRSRREMFTYSWGMFVLVHSFLTQIFHTISIWLTVTLAVWRYIAVAHPQRNREWCSPIRTYIAIGAAWLISPLICLPIYFATEVNSREEPLDVFGNLMESKNFNASLFAGNETLWFVSLTETMTNNAVLASFNFYMYSIVIKLIPCVALTVLSHKLIKALLEAKKRRKLLTTANLARSSDDGDNESCSYALRRSRRRRISDKERQTDRTTRMLLAVLLLFLLTEFPQGILGLLSVILGSGFFGTCYARLGEVMDILALINSAINFILYCSMSRQFRTTFSQLFCKWNRLKRREPVPHHLDNNGHTATTHTTTQVTQV